MSILRQAIFRYVVLGKVWLFLCRLVSEWLVLNPNYYMVAIGSSGLTVNEVVERLGWYLDFNKSAKIWISKDGKIDLYKVTEMGMHYARPAWRLELLGAALLGRILYCGKDRYLAAIEYRLPGKVFQINWKNGPRHATWRMIASTSSRPLTRALFWQQGAILKDEHPVVLLGTGPSADLIFHNKYDDIDIIICNTAVMSERLLSTRKIRAICVSDAVYFTAPTDYTRKFLEGLRNAMLRTEAELLIDSEHYEWFSSRLPDVPTKRIVPFALAPYYKIMVGADSLNVAPAMNSVFTTLMLPYATRIYNKIHLIGFDGRPPEGVNYFWRHSSEFQIDLIETVKATETAFFKGVDFEVFNSRNDQQIGAWLDACTINEIQLTMEHPTFIESLSKLYVKKC